MRVENPFPRSDKKQQVAESVYLNTVGHVMRDLVDSPRVRNFRDQTEGTTGLSNGILLARAYSDLQNPDGKLVVTFSMGTRGDPFAAGAMFKLEGVNSEGRRISYDKPVVGVVLNTNSTSCRRGGDGVIDVTSDDFFGVLSATVRAQSILEQEGRNAMSRTKFEEAIEKIKSTTA